MEQLHLQQPGCRRWFLLGAIAIVALLAAACLPPPDPSPPPPEPESTTTTTTAPPPPSICGVSSASAASSAPAATAASSDEAGNGRKDASKYSALVEQNGRAHVLTRRVSSSSEVAQFRADAAAQGEVLAFEADGEVQALTETPTWGFVDTGFTAAWGNPASTGRGIRVAELDTGIDTSHPDLVGHFDGTSADIVANATNPPQSTTDPSTSGHGTHVAGIVAATSGNDLGVVGGAPGVTLVPVRVLGTNGSGWYSDIAAGILWAADVNKGNAQIITMSLGGDWSDVVANAIATVEDPNKTQYTHPVITAAAGNTGCSTPLFPASLGPTTPQMLPVSALCKVGTTALCPAETPWQADLPYKLATYSSRAWSGSGTPTGISAPGTQINSTLPGGGYGQLSGTSMATPFIAAVAALVIKQCPNHSAAAIVARLENSARDLGPAGPDTLYGYGRVDAAAAVQGC